MTLTASLTLCQYCEHANPADAKFCAGCGAPLHLIPCPHCGSVNQKSSKTCYQCHGELRENTEILLAGAPATASEAAAGDAESAPMPATYKSQVTVPQRQPIFVVAIILVAFAAAAYFAYQQRGVVAATGTSGANVGATPEKTPATAPAPSPANLTAGAINKASPALKPPTVAVPAPVVGKDVTASQPAPAVEPRQGKVSDPVEASSASNRETAATPRARVSRRRALTEAGISPEAPPSASVTRAVPVGSGIEKQPPRIAVCTEAIAALGLCTPGPTKGNQ